MSYNIGYFRTASEIISSFLSPTILNFTFLLLLLLHKNDLVCSATHVHITKIMKQVWTKLILTQRVKQDIKKFWYSCVNACFTALLPSHMFIQCLRLRLRLRLLLLLRLLHKCESGLKYLFLEINVPCVCLLWPFAIFQRLAFIF